MWCCVCAACNREPHRRTNFNVWIWQTIRALEEPRWRMRWHFRNVSEGYCVCVRRNEHTASSGCSTHGQIGTYSLPMIGVEVARSKRLWEQQLKFEFYNIHQKAFKSTRGNVSFVQWVDEIIFAIRKNKWILNF